MSSQPRIEIQGQAPFKQSGVYEAQISVLDTRPSDEQLRSKKFTPLWQGNFHLKVKDGVFSEIIGDSKNPLPTSVDNLNSIWVVVNDLFSSVYSIFDVTLKKTSNAIETPKDLSEVVSKNPKPKRSSKNNSDTGINTGTRGVRGATGESGDKGATGATGATGDKGPTGHPGDKGKIGPVGLAGDKGTSGDKGATGRQRYSR